MDFTVTETDGLFELKIWGVANAPGYHEILKSLTTHEKWVPGSPLIWNLLDINVDKLTTEEISEIASICSLYSDAIGPSRIAKLMSSSLVYGLNRMWEYRVFERWEAEVELFREDREAAIEWLYRKE